MTLTLVNVKNVFNVNKSQCQAQILTLIKPCCVVKQNTWLALAKQPDTDRSKVSSPQTLFFTENRDLRVVITANRLVF